MAVDDDDDDDDDDDGDDAASRGGGERAGLVARAAGRAGVEARDDMDDMATAGRDGDPPLSWSGELRE